MGFQIAARELERGMSIRINGANCTIESIETCKDKLIGSATLKTAAALLIRFKNGADPILIHPAAVVETAASQGL